jgi:hypothetical protein
MTLILDRVFAAWTLHKCWIGDGSDAVESFPQWLLVMDVFHVGGLLRRGQGLEVGSEGFEVDFVPS